MFGYALFTVNWSRGIAFVSRVGALRFKSWDGQSNTVLPNVLPPLRHFFERNTGGHNEVEMGPAKFLHALIYCSKYTEKIDLISLISFRVAAFTFFCYFFTA